VRVAAEGARLTTGARRVDRLRRRAGHRDRPRDRREADMRVEDDASRLIVAARPLGAPTRS
jgi:hypothetical protein